MESPKRGIGELLVGSPELDHSTLFKKQLLGLGNTDLEYLGDCCVTYPYVTYPLGLSLLFHK